MYISDIPHKCVRLRWSTRRRLSELFNDNSSRSIGIDCQQENISWRLHHEGILLCKY